MAEFKKIFSFILLSAALIFSGCGKENAEGEEHAHHEEEQSETVRLSEKSVKEIGLQTEKVTMKPFTGLFIIPAKVVTNQDNEALVGSLVQGRVHKVYVKVGDAVKPGQALMSVEGLEIGTIKAAYLSARANLEFRKANYDRQKMLNEQKVGAQKSLLEAQAEYDKARADFNAEDKKIHSIGLTDDEVLNGKGGGADDHTSGTLTVKSPITGIVAERNVVIGQLVDGTTNAFRIINTSSVWVDGQVTEKDISRLSGNMNVSFASSSFPEEEFRGKVSYIGQEIDEKTRTMTVRAEFSNRNNALKAQMFGELRIPASEKTLAVMVPQESVVKMENRDFVFVQTEPFAFQRREVKTGAAQGGFVEIREGLQEGDTVVVKGAFLLKSEMLKSELEEEH